MCEKTVMILMASFVDDKNGDESIMCIAPDPLEKQIHFRSL